MNKTESAQLVQQELDSVRETADNLFAAKQRAMAEAQEAREGELDARQELADKINQLRSEYGRRIENYEEMQAEALEAAKQARRNEVAFRYLSGEMTLFEAIMEKIRDIFVE